MLAKLRDYRHYLINLFSFALGVIAFHRVRHAGIEMIFHHEIFDAVKRSNYGARLREYINTIPVILQHFLDPANLTLDSTQPGERFFGMYGSHVHPSLRPSALDCRHNIPYQGMICQ